MPPLARMACAITAILSGLISLVSLVPARAGGFMSDGGRLLRLVRGGPEADREAATLVLLAFSTSGRPPREWPAALVNDAIRLTDHSLEESFAWLMAYYHHLDAGDRAAAAAAMARSVALLDRWPALAAPGLRVEAAYFAAASGDAGTARAHLAQIPDNHPGVKPHERGRALAACALAEGNAPLALELARDAVANLPEHSAFAAARLNELIRLAHTASARPIPA